MLPSLIDQWWQWLMHRWMLAEVVALLAEGATAAKDAIAEVGAR